MNNTPLKNTSNNIKHKSSNKDGKYGKQLCLDFGQKSIHTIHCKVCDMSYTRAQPYELKLHERYHKNYVSGVEVSSLLKLKSMKLIKDDILINNERCFIIMISNNWNAKLNEKVEEIHKFLNTSLNAPELPIDVKSNSQTYIFINDKNRCLGACITSPINFAFKVDTHNFDQNQLSSLTIDKSRRYNVKIGIHRIHVLSQYRRKGIASRILNAISGNSIYGNVLATDDLAFSQPTTDGARLALKWNKCKPDFLVFED